MKVLLPQSLLSLFTDRLHGVIKIATHLHPAAVLARGGSAAYGVSYSSVTSSSNIRNEIGVMRFPCHVRRSFKLDPSLQRSHDHAKTGAHSTVSRAVQTLEHQEYTLSKDKSFA